MDSAVEPMKTIPASAHLREALIFRREAPAGMDGDNAALFGLADDKIKIEIRIGIRAQDSMSSWAEDAAGEVLSISVAVMTATA